MYSTRANACPWMGALATACKLLFQQNTTHKVKALKGEVITKIIRFLFSVLSISSLLNSVEVTAHEPEFLNL